VFIILAFQLETNEIKKTVTLLTTVIFAVIAPIMLFVILRHKGKLIDQDASLKEERTFPFIIAIFFYTAGFYVLINFKINVVSIAFWFCYISNTLLTILINRRWKISAHSMGAAGPLAAITFLFGPIALLFSIVVVLVGWSRIQLKCHTFFQVAGGAVLAFISTYFQIYSIVKIYG
jgi:membrane-associated phospholipid phosphatase